MFKIHDFEPLSNLFFPNLKISENSKGQFIFNDLNNVFNLNFDANKINYEDVDFHNIIMKTISSSTISKDSSSYNCIITIDSLKGYNFEINDRIDVNTYITNNKRRTNSLYSDFGFEKTRRVEGAYFRS